MPSAAAPGDKEPWPVAAPQLHAAFCSRASRLPRGYGQRPWGPQQPQRPTDIICHRSPTPVAEALYRAAAHAPLTHSGRGSAASSAPHILPPGNRRCVELVRRPPPMVGGRPATRGLERRGHTGKGTRGRPTAQTGGRGTNLSKPPLASRARRHWPRAQAPTIQPTGPMRPGAPHPCCNAA